MSIHLGSNIIKKLFIGSAQVKKAYLGSDLVYINALPVTYYVDTGTSYTEEVEPGMTVLSPASFTPTKSGYVFVGWREDSTASSDVLSTKTMGDSPISLYAVFSKSVRLTKYNASNTASTEDKNIYYNNNNVLNPTFTLTQGALSGWTKAGWTTNASGYSAEKADGATITLSANATYYTLYTASVTVTKYTNGSGGTSTESKNRVANVHSSTTYNNPSFTLTEPDLSGWTKYGWADAADFTADVANGGSVTLTGNKTYYALYTQNITVTYYNNSSTASTSVKARYVRAGGSWSFSNPTFNLTVAAVSGWTVRGWSTSNAANATISYNSATNFTRDSNCTLYASWSANVTVTYYNNSSTASTSTKAKYRGYKGDVTAATFNLTEATVSGWTARGWSTSSGASAAISYNNATNFTRTSACTLYASWSKTVTISYNGNGNTGGSTASNTGTAYRGYKGDVTNASITLQSNGFSKTSYKFIKWAAGSAGGTQYAVGATYSTSSDTTMYATWQIAVTNFGYTGGVQTFTAKAGITYKLEVWGAQGGSVTDASTYWYTASGGNGGYAQGNFTPSSDTTLYIVVGGQGSLTKNGTASGGYNGGGRGIMYNQTDFSWYSPYQGGCSGGGATHIGKQNALLQNTSVSNLLIAAGGGGGAGVWAESAKGGGTGGGTNGGSGESASSAAPTGGSQSAGGSGMGISEAGSYGKGGDAQSQYSSAVCGGAGGGGGYYGGGSSVEGTNTSTGGAGGGSGYTGGVTSGSMSNGQRTGDGYATITIV